MKEIKPFGTSRGLIHEDPGYVPERKTDKHGIIRENGQVVFVPMTQYYPDPVEIPVTAVGQLEPGDIIELVTVDDLLERAQVSDDYYTVATVARFHASELLFFKNKICTVSSIHKQGSVVVPEQETEDNGGRVWDSRVSSVTDSEGGTVYSMHQGLLYNTQTWYPEYRITAKSDFCYTTERISPVPYHPQFRCFRKKAVPVAITDAWFLAGLIKTVWRVMYDNERITALKEAHEEIEKQKGTLR